MAIVFSDIEDEDYNGIKHFSDEDEEYVEKNMSCHFEQNDDDENIRHFGD